MSLYIRKRVLNTFKRLKFKAENKNSHIYGYFQPVKTYKTQKFLTYEIEKIKILLYPNGEIYFYYNHNIQVILKSFFRTTLISSSETINKMIDECDDLTNNNTR